MLTLFPSYVGLAVHAPSLQIPFPRFTQDCQSLGKGVCMCAFGWEKVWGGGSRVGTTVLGIVMLYEIQSLRVSLPDVSHRGPT